MNFPAIKITDTDYYYMIENQIRSEMPKFEVGIMLPLAEKLLKFSNIRNNELVDFPVEGYYYKTEGLRRYFKILRNLQHNKDIFNKISGGDLIWSLQQICHNPLFGEEKEYPVDDWKDAPLKRRYDILTLTMEDKELFNPNEPRPWSIDRILTGLDKYFKGRVNLVELAFLTGNPRTLLCGAESNSAYRMYAMITGCYYAEREYVWGVSSNMEWLGKKVIDAYNTLIGSSMVVPTIFNHQSLNNKPELPRVAQLGKVLTTNEKYFWVLDKNDYFYDKYTQETITTESLN